MVIIKNVQLLTGELVTLHIDGAYFSQVLRQKERETVAGTACSLATFASQSQNADFVTRHGQVTVDAEEALLVPAAIDCHVHSREPGHAYKEDWLSLGRSAFKGGVVAVVDMPNTSPPTLFRQEVLAKAEYAGRSGLDFRFLLGLNADNIASFARTLEDESLPLAGMKIYYGRSTGNLLYSDLERLHHELGAGSKKLLVFHSEDQCRIDARYEELSLELSRDAKPESYRIHSRIRDSQSAWASTQAILNWALEWQRKVHIAHVSTPEELEFIEAARNKGGQVTCEVCPHHLLLSTEDYSSLGAYLKVNPPVRTRAETERLSEYVRQAKVDCFATDHAPHSRQEKALPYEQCPSGMPSIEFFWPLFYECISRAGALWSQAQAMIGTAPAQLFGFPKLGAILPAYKASFVWLRKEKYRISEAEIGAKCGWSPYLTRELPVRVQGTWHQGRCVYLAPS